ncbi:1-acylglycerol-3-phosphate O-acyltransferase ABHD5-like isoform X3 [Varroa jacobsoni]|uniref:1-acylglycerol-3-phosphate O-acyltransferase ABHD5-like isoform X3 n=1 Tax=Varroa jacobsoni TaxID=62625 RepID=UPI000BF5BDD0|nr:1-acylglycerol-3-phosphate O-acyltransferase ABHD5-like isoform X3 [Varroa jacobsoni]
MYTIFLLKLIITVSSCRLQDVYRQVLIRKIVVRSSTTSTKTTKSRNLMSFAMTAKPYEIIDVDIGCLGDIRHCKIHTIKQVPSSSNPPGLPLLLVHGFGCGGAIFAPNLDALSETRDVYAIDMLGFGQSSRASLSNNALEAEIQMVHSIEMWRSRVKLDQFILLGHSLGGFVSSAYALRYSSRVHHLILEDPWGFAEFDPTRKNRLPLWGRAITNTLEYINVLSAIRAAGPAGFGMMKKILNTRSYYMSGYLSHMPDTIPEYLYHCNVRRPTGEEFFRHISHKFGWTRHPMGKRMVEDLPISVGITFIFGTRTFITRKPSIILQNKRGEDNVVINVIDDCGHTIHLERPQEFNDIVRKTLARVDPVS